MTLQNAFGDLALDATLAAASTKLDAILTELGTKLDGGGTVALDSASLAALESISASVTNWPGDFPDTDVLAKLETIRLLLASGISITGTVSVAGGAADGAAATGNPVPVSGVDGSGNVQTLRVASDGSLYVELSGGAQDTTVQDLVHLLAIIATRLGYSDNGRMAVTLTGTTPAVAQSGTWTVQPGNTANTTPWLVNQLNSGLDQHYQSLTAFAEGVRSKITVT